MRRKCITLTLVLWVFALSSYAQYAENRVENLTTSWIGNSFPGGAKWVQHTICKAQVKADGKVYTYTNWDEAHREGGIYQGKQNPDQSWYGDVIGSQSKEAAFANVIGHKVTIDGVEWYIEGYVDHPNYETGRPRRIGTKVKKSGTSIEIADLERATSLGIDRKNNLLMVTDAGPTRQTVRFYNTNGEFVKQLGIPGGIWPENVGGDPSMNGVIDSDFKFWSLVGCGTDSSGNIILVMSDEWKQSGSVIRAFNPQGTEVLWEVHSYHFTEFADMDRTTDGVVVFGMQERFEMDYSKVPGQQYNLVGYTLNPYKYPNDWRLSKHVSSPMVRYIEGKKFLFFTGMWGGLWIYKFNHETDGEIAIPSQEQLASSGGNTLYVGENGDYYEIAINQIRKTPVEGIDLDGNIIWGAQVTYPKPAIFDRMLNACYVGGPDDVMIVGGFFPDDTDRNGWWHVGKRMVRFNNWNTNPTPVWDHHFTAWYHMDANVMERRVNKTIHAVGDYVFVDWVNYNGNNTLDRPGVIEVFSLATGVKVGEVFVGEEVMNQSSWHDLMNSFNVMQRSNGEYLILGEENWKSKILVFRWCPSGDCSNGSISISHPNSGEFVKPNQSITFQMEAYHEAGIAKVQLFAGDVLIGENTQSPYSITWDDITEETHSMYAKLISLNNDTLVSFPIKLNAINRKPLVSLQLTPNQENFDLGGMVTLLAEAEDIDGTIAHVTFYVDSVEVDQVSSSPYSATYEFVHCGEYKIFAVATDDLGATKSSNTFTINAVPPGDGKGNILMERWNNISGNFVNNLLVDYKFTGAPNSTSLLQSFESPTGAGSNYGARIRGYLHPPETGDYTFWLATDDGGELWLSTDTTVQNKVKIATVTDWALPREWEKLTSQKSDTIELEKGKKYYVEVLFKQGSGGDNAAVAWQGSCLGRSVILGRYLSPFVPSTATQPFDVTISSSASSDTVEKDTPIVLSVETGLTSDKIKTVLLYINGSTPLTLTAPGFSTTLGNKVPGKTTYVARIIDNTHNVVDSKPRVIKVEGTTNTSTLTIEEHECKNLIIYPNPATDYIHLRLNDNSVNTGRIVVTDVLSRNKYFYSGTIHEDHKLDVSGFEPGMYVIQIFRGSARSNGIFIKR